MFTLTFSAHAVYMVIHSPPERRCDSSDSPSYSFSASSIADTCNRSQSLLQIIHPVFFRRALSKVQVLVVLAIFLLSLRGSCAIEVTCNSAC
jgi:hypothetical protein